MSYTKPVNLVEGDHVAIIAPSSSLEKSRILAGLEVLEACKLVPVFSPNIELAKKSELELCPLAVEDRVDDLIWAFTEPEFKAVIAGDGGFGAATLLPLIPWNELDDKIFMGFSDATAINNALLAKKNLISYSGPMISTRPKNKGDINSLLLALEFLLGESDWKTEVFNNVNIDNIIVHKKGRASGTVIGGNLSTFTGLLGSEFMPDTKDAVLFIEDQGMNSYQLLLYLSQLDVSGILDDISGVIIGEFSNMEPTEPGDPSLEEVISEYFGDDSCKPCMSGFNFSHGDTTAVFPIGASCNFDTDTKLVKFDL
jgi:muramoyltetrapeptide carboxypeptidase